jgi:hypothetical protein
MASSSKVIVVPEGFKDVSLTSLDERDVFGKLFSSKDAGRVIPQLEAIHEREADGVRRYFIRNGMSGGYSNATVRTSADVTVPANTLCSIFCTQMPDLMDGTTMGLPKSVPIPLDEDERAKKTPVPMDLHTVIRRGKRFAVNEGTPGAKMTKVSIPLSETVVMDPQTLDFLAGHRGDVNKDPTFPELVTHMIVEADPELDTEEELKRLFAITEDVHARLVKKAK